MRERGKQAMQIIAVIAYTDNILTDISEFKSALERLGYTVHLEQLGYNLRSMQIGYFEEDSLLLWLGRCYGDLGRCQEIAAYYAQAEPDVIVAMQGPAIRAVLDSSPIAETPVVFTHIADPYIEGFLHHDDKIRQRLTGVCDSSLDSSVERLKLLAYLVPAPTMVHVFADPGDLVSAVEVDRLRDTGASIGIDLIVHPVRNPEETRQELAILQTRPDQAILRTTQPWLDGLSGLLGVTAYERYIPYIGVNADEMERCGALFTLDRRGIGSQAANIVDRILNGHSPETISFQTPERLSLGVNLQAARDLGLVISPALVEQAQIVVPQNEHASLGGKLLLALFISSLLLGLIGTTAAITSTLPWFAVMAIATILVVFLLWRYLQKHIIEPIQKLTRVAQQIGAGNLKVEIGESRVEDEIGVLRRALRRLRNNLKHFQAEINSLTTSLQQQIQERTEAYQALQAAQRQLEIANRRIIDADDSARFALTTYIHDEVLSLLDEMVSQAQRDGNQALMTLVEKVDRRIRKLRVELSVPVIRDMDVELRRLLQETLPLFYPEHNQLKLSINLSGLKDIPCLEQSCAVLLYRFVHGAMTNIYRHAHAKQAKVEAIRQDNDLVVRVSDDGIGFNPSLIEGFINDGHFFFHDIVVRARQLEGDLKIISNESRGTCLEVAIPINRCVSAVEG